MEAEVLYREMLEICDRLHQKDCIFITVSERGGFDIEDEFDAIYLPPSISGQEDYVFRS